MTGWHFLIILGLFFAVAGMGFWFGWIERGRRERRNQNRAT